jgi:TonB-dependent starch-binding outer membrane protein SusC
MIRYLNKKCKTPSGAFQRLGLLLLGLVFVNLSIFAQTQIKGTLTDAKTGETLPGVSVLVDGTTIGTITGMDGKYSISVPADKNVLVFNFIGFIPQKVTLTGQTEISIQLLPDVKYLDEVVVVGYGTMRRGDISGAISSISAKELKDIPVTSAAEAITGRMAGVQVTSTDGSPDATVSIRVRGGGSVTQDNSPLYVVDGFVVSNINDISPNDIATIDVLKDASTAGIYGARGANGVILITTKTPKAGKTTISYNGYYLVKTLPKKLSVLSPYEFVNLQYELALLQGTTQLNTFTNNYGVYDDLELYKNKSGTDWQKETFGQNTESQSHNLSISGGNQDTRYNFSITRENDPGLMIQTGYARTNLMFRLSHQISKALAFDFNTRFSDTRVDGAGTDNVNVTGNTVTGAGPSVRIKNAVVYRPVNGFAEFVDANVDDLTTSLDGTAILYDPVKLASQSYRKQIRYATNMNGAVSWTIKKGLVARTEFGYDYKFNRDNWFWGQLTTTAANNGNLPLAQIINTSLPGYRWSNTITYNVSGIQGKHDLTVLAGQEILSNNSSSVTSLAKSFQNTTIDPEKALATMAQGDAELTTTNITPYDRTTSFFGRLNYGFNKIVLASFLVRADGSTKFAPGHQWGYFPAGSVALRLSDLDFLKNSQTISTMKLRFAYGAAGNNRISDDQWRTTYTLQSALSSRPIGFGEVAAPYYSANSALTNPLLKWETTITRNLGLDFGLFKDRLTGTFEIYKNTTKDLLVQSTVPQYLGYTTQLQNIGQTSNKGIELSLNAMIINTKDVTLSATFNVGINRSNVDKLDGVNNTQYVSSSWASTDLREVTDYALIVGKPVGLMYGYVNDGMYTVNDFNYNPSTQKYSLKPGIVNDNAIISAVNFGPGSMKIKKLTSDTAMTISADKDRTVIGDANPKHVGGFNISGTYKWFDLSLFFNWVYGNKIYNANKIDFTTSWKYVNNNMLSIMDNSNRYKYIDASGNKVTDPAALTALNQGATIWSPLMGRPVLTSWAIEDGSFLRLNNVTVGFTVPKELTQKVKLEKFRVYFTIHNAWIWTNYSGYDPEVSTGNNNNLTPGLDYSGYPKNRSYTVGLNVTF